MDTGRLIQPDPLSQTCRSSQHPTYPTEIMYSPAGLQSRSFTGPLWPLIAPISLHCAVSGSPIVACTDRQRLHPPFHPQPITSSPCVVLAQSPPTNPPRRCPPTSPNRCRLIHIEPAMTSLDDAEFKIWLGDHRIKEESVELDRRVCSDEALAGVDGAHASDVTPASCPMSSASKVMAYCWTLFNGWSHNHEQSVEKDTPKILVFYC